MNFYKTSVPNPVLFSPHLPKMDSRYVVLGGIFATLHRKLYASELRELDVRQRRIAGPGAHVNWNEPWHDVCFLLDPLFLRVVCLERFFPTLPVPFTHSGRRMCREARPSPSHCSGDACPRASWRTYVSLTVQRPLFCSMFSGPP